MYTAFHDRYPSDVTRPCECCGTAQAQRNGYCLSCEAAEINLLMAEACDVDASLSDDDVNAFAAEQAAAVTIDGIRPLWIGPCALCGCTGSSIVTRSCPRCGGLS